MRSIAVVGLGLVGGSLGMRIREFRLGRVVGIDVDPDVVDRALAVGAADDGSTDLAGVRGSEVVIVAVPLRAITDVTRAVAAVADQGTIVTDVGSVKAPVVRQLAGMTGLRFLGGHPMFGTEAQGIGAARGDLPAGAPYVLTPSSKTDDEAVAVVMRLARDLEMRPVVMEPETHDRLVAQVSHLPYLMALALRGSAEPEAVEMAGPAFRDATRVAQSPAALWEDIMRLNRQQILAAMDRLTVALLEVRRRIERGEPVPAADSMEEPR